MKLALSILILMGVSFSAKAQIFSPLSLTEIPPSPPRPLAPGFGMNPYRFESFPSTIAAHKDSEDECKNKCVEKFRSEKMNSKSDNEYASLQNWRCVDEGEEGFTCDIIKNTNRELILDGYAPASERQR